MERLKNMTAKKGAQKGNQNAAKEVTLDSEYKIRINGKELESAKKRHGGAMANNIRNYLKKED